MGQEVPEGNEVAPGLQTFIACHDKTSQLSVSALCSFTCVCPSASHLRKHVCTYEPAAMERAGTPGAAFTKLFPLVQLLFF